MNTHGLIIALLVTVVSISVYTDLRSGKILNKIVLPCVPLGLLIWGIADGANGILFSLGGMAIGSIALLLAAALRWIAPGDAKLILAIGALTGARFVSSAMVYCALAGGLMALIFLARKRLLMPLAAGAMAAWANQLPFSTVWATRAGYIPYSFAIAAGVALASFFPLW
jgi:prepilin peptidase CpaA